ncbi:MAG TPA: DUF2202 domain-containing protein [Methanoregula sp.]|nr:DUF2202 domain-containing protein [Methanoregula sp.]
MIKKFSIFALLALILLPAGVLAAGAPGTGSMYGSPDRAEVTASVGSAQTLALTADEISWLTYIREEEKVARDVYLKMYDKYKVRIFKNIATSEQRHMDAIKILLDKYSVPDPAAGRGIGEFTNPDLQKLYDNLIVLGSISRIEAFKVGVIIEETDIDDLNKASTAAQHDDIITVYNNLLRGSHNHLDAFESYVAKY